MLTESGPLTKAFRDTGFAIVRAAFSGAELARARLAADELAASADRNSRDIFTNYYLRHRPENGVLYDLYQRHPAFHELVHHPPLVAAVRDVYGPNFYLYENSLVFKPRGRENGVPWHQDFMNRVDEPWKVIAWIPLDDVDEENGCMYAIPGSHTKGYLPLFRVRGQTHHTRVRSEFVDETKQVPLEMSAGDVLLFHCHLLHSSRPIHSDRPRRAYRCAFQSFEVSATPRATPIVVSLEDPTVLDQVHDYEPNRLKCIAHKIGRRLLDW